MSYILDALKKSEQERGHGNIPGVQTVHSSSLNYHKDRRPVWPWFLSVIIIINMAGVIYFVTSRDNEKAVAAKTPVTIDEETTKTTTTTTTPNIHLAAPPESSSPSHEAEDEAIYINQDVQQQVSQTALAQQTYEPAFETVDINDLPLSIRQHIPGMTFSAHVYSTNPTLRSIVINDRFMEEGGMVTSDLVLNEITPHGAIFDFQGYRFSTSITPGWN